MPDLKAFQIVGLITLRRRQVRVMASLHHTDDRVRLSEKTVQLPPGEPDLPVSRVGWLSHLLFGAMLRPGQPVAVQFLPHTVGPLSDAAYEQVKQHRLVIDTAFEVAIELAVEAGHTVRLVDESIGGALRP